MPGRSTADEHACDGSGVMIRAAHEVSGRSVRGGVGYERWRAVSRGRSDGRIVYFHVV